MMDEPGIPGRLAAAIRVSGYSFKCIRFKLCNFKQSWPEPIAEARAKDLFADTLLPVLDDLHRKQMQSCVVSPEETDRYPF